MFETKDREFYKEKKTVEEGFVYRSDTNEKWLTKQELKKMINEIEIES